MTPEQNFRQLVGLGVAWRGVGGTARVTFPTLVFKVEEAAALWPKEDSLAGTSLTCQNHSAPI
jgi:hypothetical protein